MLDHVRMKLRMKRRVDQIFTLHTWVHTECLAAMIRCRVVFSAYTFATPGALKTKVTETQSLTLVKNLIRVSISTVCSLRGIFPQVCFQERTYGKRSTLA